MYFGRGTCPYCRDFVPELNKVSKEKNVTINYLDTENIENDAQIQSLRERYDVEFVPTLIHLSDHGNNIKTFNAETDSLNEFFEDIRVNNEI